MEVSPEMVGRSRDVGTRAGRSKGLACRVRASRDFKERQVGWKPAMVDSVQAAMPRTWREHSSPLKIRETARMRSTQPFYEAGCIAKRRDAADISSG